MRKIYLFMMVALDGFFEGLDREIDWHNVDDEFNEFASNQLDNTDLILFGRITYELMSNYWPTSEAIKNDPIIANKMNAISKIVYSKTLERAEWKNTKLIKDILPEEISKIKQQPGKDIAVFGSSDLSVSLMQLGLIDEFRIMINPVVLGKGKPIFNGIDNRFYFKLIKTRTFNSGNVLLYYQPDKDKTK